MAVFNGINNNSNQTIDISAINALGSGQAGNSVTMYGGNDIVIGSGFNDLISGGAGNDILRGNAGDDFLNGEDGRDTLLGGIGNDSLYGGIGNDVLNGEIGFDFLCGGSGDDTYIHSLNSGNDIINDNQTVTGAVGSGGGISDVLQFSGLSLNNIVASYFINNKVNLYLSSYADLMITERLTMV